MYSFAEDFDDGKDQLLVRRVCAGSFPAAVELVGRHQDFLFNILLRLSGDNLSGSRILDEVFVRMMTELEMYDRKESFRLWLYRLALDHFSSQEQLVSEDSGSFSKEPGQDCPKIMLLTLERPLRMAFVLGAIFALRERMAATMIGIQADEFERSLTDAKTLVFQRMELVCDQKGGAGICYCRRVGSLLHKELTVGRVVGIKLTDIEEMYMQGFRAQRYESSSAKETFYRLLRLGI